MNTDTVVVAQGLSRHYEVKSHLFSPPRITQALTEANFRLQAGKTLAVVGESGWWPVFIPIHLLREYPELDNAEAKDWQTLGQ